MALDLFLAGSPQRPTLRGDIKDITEALKYVQDYVNEESLGGDGVFEITVTFEGGVNERAVPSRSVSGAVTIDLSEGTNQTLNLTGNVSGITFSNRPPDGTVSFVKIDWIQDENGSRTVSHSGMAAPDSTAPEIYAAPGSRSSITYEINGPSGLVIARTSGVDIGVIT